MEVSVDTSGSSGSLRVPLCGVGYQVKSSKTRITRTHLTPPPPGGGAMCLGYLFTALSYFSYACWFAPSQ